MTVSLDATDESSGVGLTEYMINGSEWSTYVDQFGLSDDGTGSAVFMADAPLWGAWAHAGITVWDPADMCREPDLNLDYWPRINFAILVPS